MSVSRQVKRAPSKSNVREERKPVMTLHEEVNPDDLLRLISAKDLPSKVKRQLTAYHAKIDSDGRIPVKYFYSSKLQDTGRLFADSGLSLQSFSKRIRHFLAKDRYIDIDIANCHPTLLRRYCELNDIETHYLDIYCEQRDEILNEIGDFHGLDRDASKKLVLRLCYLGSYMIEIEDPITGEITYEEPPKKMKWLREFRKEQHQIANDICSKEKEIRKRITSENTDDEDDNDENIFTNNVPGQVLSIVIQQIENKCIMAIYNCLKKLEIDAGVLCFDGLMVPFSEIPHQYVGENGDYRPLLDKCEQAVNDKTNYFVSLTTKPMDLPLGFDVPKYSKYVKSDLEAQKRLFLIEGANKFKYCNGQLYIFDDRTGMYDTDIEVLYYYLVKNSDYLQVVRRIDKEGKEHTDSYGSSANLQRNVVQFVKTAALDNTWTHRTDRSSLGYLLFKDGIYNMKTGEFSTEFDPNIVFHCMIPWNFPKYNKKEIQKVYNMSFGSLFKDAKPMIYSLARAIAGDTIVKRFFFCPGRTGSGKSTLTKMLSYAFGNYVGTFNAESLAHTSSLDTKDEAAKNRWAFLARYCRILISNEANMKRELNSDSIKKHSSGGDTIVGRVHHGNEINFVPHFTCFCMLNDIPEIKPLCEAILDRLTYIEFPYQFVDDKEVNKSPNFKPKDNSLMTSIDQEWFVGGFIHIILDAYKDYLKNGMPEYDNAVKDEWTQDSKDVAELRDIIEKHFTVTGIATDRVTFADMKAFRDNNKNNVTCSLKQFNDFLRGELGIKDTKSTIAGKSVRFWAGIRKKECDD